MSCMKRLKEHIEMRYPDEFEKEIVTNEINQYIHDEIDFNSLSTQSQEILYIWEAEEEQI